MRIGRVSVVTCNCPLGPTGTYWNLLKPTVISLSMWLHVFSVLSACYCLDKHCVLKSLVTPEYDRIIRQLLPTILCITACCTHQIHPSALFAISLHASPSVLYCTKSSTPTASRATSRTYSQTRYQKQLNRDPLATDTHY